MPSIERQLQLCLNRIEKWCLENGFRFSKTKTCCIHFCNSRKLHKDPELFLNKCPIEVVTEAKFPGLIFDSKLSFIPHIKYLKSKCLKALDLLKVISNTKWGGDEETLLQLYRTLIRSKLDYGSIIYGSARPSYIKQLDTIHHQGLRLCLGAFKTSPVESLYTEANEPSLKERRIKLAIQYIIKLKAHPSNHAYQCIFHPENKHLFLQHPNAIPPLGIRMNEHFENINIDLSQIAKYKLSVIPPWQFVRPIVDLNLTNNKKSVTNQLSIQQEFHQLASSLPRSSMYFY